MFEFLFTIYQVFETRVLGGGGVEITSDSITKKDCSSVHVILN